MHSLEIKDMSSYDVLQNLISISMELQEEYTNRTYDFDKEAKLKSDYDIFFREVLDRMYK